MVFSSVRTKIGVIGDLKYEIWSLTDVTIDALSTVTTSMNGILYASASSSSAAPGVIKANFSGGVVTLDAEVADDDGTLFVIGK